MTAHAQAYLDPGTPEEQSRRQFLANATLAIGGVIGLVVAVPCVAALIPESLVKPNAAGGPVWAPLTPAELSSLRSGTDTPVKIDINFKYQDGYLPPSDAERLVWGVKLTPEQVATFQKKRPDLFKPTAKVDYPAITLNFVLFSSICPHLGCKFDWVSGAKRFICPCHGSQFDVVGAKLAGPAPRGLDPLPFREQDGKAEVTWIQYKSQTPDRIIVAYT